MRLILILLLAQSAAAIPLEAGSSLTTSAPSTGHIGDLRRCGDGGDEGVCRTSKALDSFDQLDPELHTKRKSRNQAFWDIVREGDTATEQALARREELFDRALEIASKEENQIVQQHLETAVEHFRGASHVIALQTLNTEREAEKQAVKLPAEGEVEDTLRTSGLDFIEKSHAALVDPHGEQLREDRNKRILLLEPLLEAGANNMGDVLSNLRNGKNAAWEVTKFDIYHNKILDYKTMDRKFPKTSQTAKDVAQEMRETGDELRKEYMGMIMGFAHAIIADFGGGTKHAPKGSLAALGVPEEDAGNDQKEL